MAPIKILFWHYGKGFFWLRLFYHGISIMNRNIHAPLFSERNGYKKVFRIGNYAIAYLPPYPHLRRKAP